jgi:signal-transduction protein with cAMP-binding, CBS, and nucleotidyltransferase domain
MADQALLCAKRAGRDCIVRYASIFDAASQPQKFDQREGTFQGVLARDIMSPLTESLCDNQTVGNAIEFFVRSQTPSSPVLNADGLLVGFLSESDLMSAMLSNNWRQSISTLMRSNVISYEEETPIRVIHEFLCRVSIHRVVITKNGLPTGVINRNSLLQWFYRRASDEGSIAPLPSLPVSSGYNTADTASVP